MLQVKSSYEYEVDQANIYEDVATMNQDDNKHTNDVHENLPTIELPQHRNFDKEGNIRNDDECITYS